MAEKREYHSSKDGRFIAAILILTLGIMLYFYFYTPDIFQGQTLACASLFSFFIILFVLIKTRDSYKKMELTENRLTISYWFLPKKEIDLSLAKAVLSMRMQTPKFSKYPLPKCVLKITPKEGNSLAFSFMDDDGMDFAEEVKKRFDSLRNKGPDNP